MNSWILYVKIMSLTQTCDVFKKSLYASYTGILDNGCTIYRANYKMKYYSADKKVEINFDISLFTKEKA